MRNHLGTSFKVWSRRQSWFWLVLNHHDKTGAIGTAGTEADAVREACSSIEEMAAQRGPISSLRPADTVSRAIQLLPCETAVSWFEWWMGTADQLTDMMLTRWADLVLRSS